MSDEDFSNLLGGDVKPINFEKRVAVKQSADRNVDKSVRRVAAENEQKPEEDPLSSAPEVMLDPYDVLSFVRPGVQHGVYRNLRQGKYQIDARLDLHRLTVEQARKAVFQFVTDCVSNDVRMALITHGKGEGRNTPALLKSHVNHWLPQLDLVLAYHTAQKWHGGYGATYVLLKKSDKKSEQAREANLKNK
ncbi:DNA endonuclease SmrA [Teredinibacter sp. KSP-S5-2]|uniref:DNA endonuclease SmrA n=1 Tax=Teredinibacter sp. KSP-S5-2 TaxID=3034506 RepID=UPI0029341A62|nr:DNA endonuclease SmrA [Teredinibacter sp. KSP-S5-2]WNO08141.1 DNA endonuclease SmrA [Teredinibacter sp. KSP-S5-2]